MKIQSAAENEKNICPVCHSSECSIAYRNLTDFRYGVGGAWLFVCCDRCHVFYLTGDWNTGIIERNSSVYSQYSVPEVAPLENGGTIKTLVRKMVLKSYGYYTENTKPTLGHAVMARCFPGIFLQATWGQILFPRRIADGCLLDIGCGNGRYLKIMDMLGWKIWGVEPDGQSAEIARAVSGAKIFSSTEEIKNANVQFDLITMNHVIEHISNPRDVLQDCYSLLKPHGMLAVSTPNRESLTHRIFKKFWYSLDFPRHKVLYTCYTLQKIFEEMGFAVLINKTTSLREGMVAFKKSYQYRFGETPSPAIKLAWYLFSAIAALALKNSGEEIVLWAQKKSG